MMRSAGYHRPRNSRPGGLMGSVGGSKPFYTQPVTIGLAVATLVLLCSTGWLWWSLQEMHHHVDQLDVDLHALEVKSNTYKVQLEGKERQIKADRRIHDKQSKDDQLHAEQLEDHIATLHEEKTALKQQLNKALSDHADAQAVASGGAESEEAAARCKQDLAAVQAQLANARRATQGAETKAGQWKALYDQEVLSHANTAASLDAALGTGTGPVVPPVPPAPVPAVPPVPPAQAAATPPVPRPAQPPVPRPAQPPPPQQQQQQQAPLIPPPPPVVPPQQQPSPQRANHPPRANPPPRRRPTTAPPTDSQYVVDETLL